MIEIEGKYNIAKLFTNKVDAVTYSQVQNIVNQKALADAKIRIMSDCHAGAGCVIGTTMNIIDKIIPNLVGVDISCGMDVTYLGNIELDVKMLDEYINKYIPSGFNNNVTEMCHLDEIENMKCLPALKKKKSANYNLAIGSLGGGNHFIEINKDDKGNKYLVVHSGSRNLGKMVAEHYQHVAIDSLRNRYNLEATKLVKSLKKTRSEALINEELAKLKTEYTVPDDLCYLTKGDMTSYLYDMKVMQKYAHANRTTMARRIVEEGLKLDYDSLERFETLHNYIDLDAMILRKGAVSAKAKETLIIPINMRDGSLICVGKGNPDWNNSAPHGAGRLMGRNEAKKNFKMADFEKSMEGIYTTSICQNTIDESPMAYKPIEEIIENIGDTVEIVGRIKPIYNFKAGGE
jgi:tRNA-splicing ligase RtcB (3'-phosphate/5'-hydroxy nucleic acid ligase)